MSGSAAPSVEEFIELLNAEQYVDLQKLRDYARHGVQPAVRGEVWLYLLGVLSDDKSQEMTSVRSKYMEYDSLEKHNVLYEKRIRREAVRYYQRNLIPRPPPGRTMARSSQRIASYNSINGAHGLSSDGLKRNNGGGKSLSSGTTAANAKVQPPLGSVTATRSSLSVPHTVITTSTSARGPNRADNGQTRVLAGIMGDLDPQRLNESEEALIDPEAAAAHEMKRFCQAVENIVCAHLNRWKWCAADGSVTLVEAEVVGEEQEDGAGSSSGAGSSDERMQQSSSQQAAGRRRTITANDKVEHVSTLLSSLPKEYEWAHQKSAKSERSLLASPNTGPPDTHYASSALSPQQGGFFIQPEYHPDLILLCSPFVKCMRSEAGIFFAFEKLMTMIEQHNAVYPLPARIATFLTLFRTTLPDLYAYFDEEEVDVIGLASAWMRHLLAAEMRIEDLMRLWDTYFAVPDPLDLHMYVCIAILTNFNDALEELDQSEAKGMLFSLPPLDVDRIINEAINIRLAHRQSEMLSNGGEEEEEED